MELVSSATNTAACTPNLSVWMLLQSVCCDLTNSLQCLIPFNFRPNANIYSINFFGRGICVMARNKSNAHLQKFAHSFLAAKNAIIIIIIYSH